LPPRAMWILWFRTPRRAKLRLMKAFVIISCLAVLAALIAGLYSMWKGGEFSRKWSNKLMRLRVALQFVAIIIIMVAFFMSRHH